MGFFCKIFKQTKNNSTGSGFMCGWKSQHNVFFTITFCQITDWLKRAPLMLPLIVLLYSVKCFELPLCGKCYIKMSYCNDWSFTSVTFVSASEYQFKNNCSFYYSQKLWHLSWLHRIVSGRAYKTFYKHLSTISCETSRSFNKKDFVTANSDSEYIQWCMLKGVCKTCM